MRSLLASLLVLAAACGGASSNTPRLDPTRLEPARLYPMREGLVWSYDVDAGPGAGPPALGITRVVGVEGSRVRISSNNSDPIAYELRPDGVYLPEHRVYLLKAPVEEGASWPSRSGRMARVVSTTEHVVTPGGTYDGCVRIAEAGGDMQLDIETVYCADVGPVVVQSATTTALTGQRITVRATLRGFTDPAQ